MKALQLKKAGASPALRLALLHHELCDPGLYQAWTIFATFRRIANKRPMFVDLWHGYMEQFNGSSKQGPFAKLLEVCRQLHWTVEVPFLLDRDGVQMQWLIVEEKQFYFRVQEAWTWKIWEEVRDRKDLTGLQGIDRIALQAAQQKVPAHHQELVRRLQDGTFVEPQTHAKYDLSKDIKCSQCGAEDSITHRCTSCPARASIYAEHEYAVRNWNLWTPAKRLHLLPSCNPMWTQFKIMACQQSDSLETRPMATTNGHRHLFTDGSCCGGKVPGYALSSWAVVDTHTDGWIARGSLGGLCQGADRAELRAVIKATEIISHEDGAATIWTDCAYVAEGMNRMLRDVRDVPQGAMKTTGWSYRGFW